MKDIIKRLASEKDMSINAYLQDLVRQDQCGMFNTMQIADKNRELISGIIGNMHDGYDVIFIDGYSSHCRTKKDVRSCIIEYCNKKGDWFVLFIWKCCLAQDIGSLAQDSVSCVSYVSVTCLLPQQFHTFLWCLIEYWYIKKSPKHKRFGDLYILIYSVWIIAWRTEALF